MRINGQEVQLYRCYSGSILHPIAVFYMTIKGLVVMSGFIPIRRRLFNHWLYKEKRTFSRFEAWLDLIHLATFQEENEQMIKGKVFVCEKGQLIASIRYMGQRWSWSKHKVCDFLELLRSQQMILIDRVHGQSLLTLINYRKYNPSTLPDIEGDSKEDSKKRHRKAFPENPGADDGTFAGTVAGHPPDTKGTNIIIGNNDNKEKENPASAGSLSQEERFQNFQKWIAQNAPAVGKMQFPFTFTEFLRIRSAFKLQDIMDVLQAMHNKRTLLKEYTSAYLTCLNWLKIRTAKNQNVRSDETANEANANIKAALQQHQPTNGR